jgi:hypothetical protein
VKQVYLSLLQGVFAILLWYQSDFRPSVTFKIVLLTAMLFCLLIYGHIQIQHFRTDIRQKMQLIVVGVSLTSSLFWYVHHCEICRHSGYYLPRSGELKSLSLNKKRYETAARKRHTSPTLYLIPTAMIVSARLFHYLLRLLYFQNANAKIAATTVKNVSLSRQPCIEINQQQASSY